ncbi:hypothetical protein ACGFMK_28820 [Amycolatopsis sp. NPDC049252]|uniref:hypothetical protein n=1 Tax=Amycolatopsis sp. NPDC049252 TaxID=3363933 RepID=UPI003720F22A
MSVMEWPHHLLSLEDWIDLLETPEYRAPVVPPPASRQPADLLARRAAAGRLQRVEYAEAGIDHYWIVDLDPPVSLVRYRLIDEDYEDFGEQSGHAELEFEGAPLKFDLNALTPDAPRS